jgi:tRNA(Ile)-lysidine synthase
MGIRPRQDSSNDDLSFARNRVRHRILPELRELNPSVSDALIRLSEAAGADHEALEAIVDDEWDVATQNNGEVLLPLAVLNHVPTAVGTRIVQRAFAVFASDRQHMLETVHINAILRVARNGAGSSIELPAGVFVKIGYENAKMSRGPTTMNCRYLPIDDQMVLEVPGSVALNSSATITADLITPPAETSGMPGSTAYLDLHTTGQSLIVRNWIEGDRFQPLGMAGEKKLSDFFIDSKIPRGWRDRIPLVLINDRIAWVAGYRIAEWAKISPETNNCVRLELADATDS